MARLLRALLGIIAAWGLLVTPAARAQTGAARVAVLTVPPSTGVALTLNATTDTATAKGYSGPPEGLFTSAIAPKNLYDPTGVLAHQNYLFRTQIESSVLNLPDIAGSAAGHGLTPGGLAWDGTNWVIAGCGCTREDLGDPFLASISRASPAGALISNIRMDTLYSLPSSVSIQGVVVDPIDGSYWAGALSYGVKHLTPAGVALSGSFVPADSNANGVGLDTKRGYLLIFNYISSTNSQLERYTRAGALVDTTPIPNTPFGDHAYYDAARDYYWLDYGANGASGGAVAYRGSDLSLVGTVTFTNALAIEGIYLTADGRFAIDHDGYFHSATSGALPAINQIQFYPAALGKADVNWPKDYHPTTHAPLGYRFEGQFIRLNDNPITQGAVQWTKNSATVTTLTQVSPDGTMDANTVTAVAATTQHYLFRAAGTFPAGSKIVVSDIVKAGTYNYVWTGSRGESPEHSASFNASTCTVIGTPSNATAATQDLGNGWCRLIRMYTLSTTSSDTGIIAFGQSTHTIDYASLALVGTETFHTFAHSIGIGDFATSPVFGTNAASSAETRAADTATLPVTAWDMSATVNDFTFEGTTAPGIGSANQVAEQIDDGSESNRYRLVRDASRVMHFIVTVGGSDVVNLSLGTVADSTSFKVAVRARANDFAASVNGGAVVTSASGALPTVTTLRMGGSFTGEQWNGAIKALGVLPAANDNSWLVAHAQ